jgi:hypothetical protein
LWYKQHMRKFIFTLITVSSLALPAFAVGGSLQNYVTDAEMYEISNRLPPEAHVEGTAVRLDTRDAIRCMRVKDYIRRSNGKASKIALEDLCKVDQEHPYKDIVVLQTAENQELLNYIKSGITVGLSAYESNKSSKTIKEDETSNNKNNEFILSPLFAAMVSESIDHLRNYVKGNGGKAANSQFLGSTILVITNPAESIADMVNGFYNYRFIHEAKTKVVLRDYRDEDPHAQKGRSPEMNALEFKLEFRFK